MELRTFSGENYIKESDISNNFSLAPGSYCILRMLFLCRLMCPDTGDEQCGMTILRNFKADISCHGNENHTLETQIF